MRTCLFVCVLAIGCSSKSTSSGDGGVCATCSASEICIDGACMRKLACNSATCTGCCDATGACKPGSDDAACGSGGGSCESCSAPRTCIDERCAVACDPTSCTGCCNTDGCEAFADQSSSACGKLGAACAACPTGQACSPVQIVDSTTGMSDGTAGTCRPTGCDGCTSGCCVVDGDTATCEPGTAAAACGSGGNLCSACTNDETCQGGLCVPNGSVMLTLNYFSAVVPSTEPDGTPWDYTSPPDVGIIARVEVATGEITSPIDDGTPNTTTPTFPNPAGITATVDQFRAGIFFDLYDEDEIGKEFMTTLPDGSAFIPTDAQLAGQDTLPSITTATYKLTFSFSR